MAVYRFRPQGGGVLFGVKEMFIVFGPNTSSRSILNRSIKDFSTHQVFNF